MDIEQEYSESETTKRVRTRKKRDRYAFYVLDDELARLRALGLSAPSILAFGLIRAASRAARRDTVSIRQRAREALGYSSDWWRKHTKELEAAGVIQRIVSPGRSARYRIIAANKQSTLPELVSDAEDSDS